MGIHLLLLIETMPGQGLFGVGPSTMATRGGEWGEKNNNQPHPQGSKTECLDEARRATCWMVEDKRPQQQWRREMTKADGRQQQQLAVDCSKGAVAWSLGQKVVLSFNGYWGKRSG